MLKIFSIKKSFTFHHNLNPMTFGSQILLKLFPKKTSSIELLLCSHALVLLMMPLHSDLKLIKLRQTGLL